MGVLPKRARLFADLEGKNEWGSKTSLGTQTQLLRPETWAASKNLNWTKDEVFNGVETDSDMYSSYEMVDGTSLGNKLRPKDYTVQMFSSLLGVRSKITNGKSIFREQFSEAVNGRVPAANFTLSGTTTTSIAETVIVTAATPAASMTIAAALSTPTRLKIEVTNSGSATTSGDIIISAVNNGMKNNKKTSSETISVKCHNNQTRVFITESFFYAPATSDITIDASGVTGGTATVGVWEHRNRLFVDNEPSYLLAGDFDATTGGGGAELEYVPFSAKILGDVLEAAVTIDATPKNIAASALDQNIPGSGNEEFYIVAKVETTADPINIDNNTDIPTIAIHGTVGSNTDYTETLSIGNQAAGEVVYYQTTKKFSTLSDGSGNAVVITNMFVTTDLDDAEVTLYAVPVKLPALNSNIGAMETVPTATPTALTINSSWNDDSKAHRVQVQLVTDDITSSAGSIVIIGTENGVANVSETLTITGLVNDTVAYFETTKYFTEITSITITATVNGGAYLSAVAFKAIDLNLSYHKVVSGISQYVISSQLGNPDNPPSLYMVLDNADVYSGEYKAVNMNQCSISSAVNAPVNLSWTFMCREFNRDSVTKPGVYDSVAIDKGGFPFLHKNLTYYILDSYENQQYVNLSSLEDSTLDINHSGIPIKGSDGTPYATAMQFGKLLVTGSLTHERDTIRWKERHDNGRTFVQIWNWVNSRVIPGTSQYYEAEIRAYRCQINADPDPDVNQGDERLMSNINFECLTDKGVEDQIIQVYITTDENVPEFTDTIA